MKINLILSIKFIMKLSFSKCAEWGSLPLYKKIKYYKTQLTAHYAVFVDKITAKNVVKSVFKDEINVTPIIRILSGPDDITEADLNVNHIIKAAHGCGWNIDITDTTTLDSVKLLLNKWNCVYSPREPETQYKFVKPRFFIEEKIDDRIVGKTGQAGVYMVRCIHGKPVTIGVKYGDRQNSYDISWNLINHKQSATELVIAKPKNLDKMLNISRKLSAPFEFVRMDFFIDFNEDIYFSEYTFTPAGGHQIFTDEQEREFGLLWQ